MTDRFIGFDKDLTQLPPEIKVITLKHLESMCICRECPSFNQCASAGDELFYCIRGRSAECIDKKSGCICGRCPVTEEIGLANIYYCIDGNEYEQRETMEQT